MKRVHLYLVLMVALGVFLAACTITGAVTGTDTPENGCAALDGGARDDCYLETLQCSKITSDSVRNACIAELALVGKDISVCGLIEDTKSQGFCLAQLSEEFNDAMICQDIADVYWADNCFTTYAKNNDQGEFCILVERTDQREDCYYDIALSSENADLCLSIAGTKQDSCLVTVAKMTNDPSICDEIVSSVFNADVCKYRVAKDNNNPSACGTITGGTVKSDCQSLFEDSDETDQSSF